MLRKSCIAILVSLVAMGLAHCAGQENKNQESGLVSISVTPANPSIAKNTDQQFLAVGIYSDNTTKDLTETVTWNSSDTEIVVFHAPEAYKTGTDKPGRAFGQGVGKAKVTATTGNVSGGAEVTVTPAVLVSISLTPTNPAIAKGTNQQFIATGTFSDNTTQNLIASVSWSSSDEGVATVSSEGLAISLAPGTTTITAKSGEVFGSAELTVTPATLVSLAVTPSSPAIAKGTTRQFTAIGTFSDDSTQDLTTSVIWSSSDTTVAKINTSGLATSVTPGTTTITAKSGEVSDSTQLTINPATLDSLVVTPADPVIAKGASQQFVATGTFSDGTTQNMTALVTWSTSSTGIATISNAPGSHGVATSVAVGTTTIKAASGSISNSTTLTVIDRSAILAWDPAVTNTDGTSLTDLAGYKIYYGTSSGNYTTTLNAGNVTTYTIKALDPGTYYFAVTAVNGAGVESSYSNEATKTIE